MRINGAFLPTGPIEFGPAGRAQTRAERNVSLARVDPSYCSAVA